MYCFKCQKTILQDDEKYGLHKKCFADWFETSELDEFCDIVRRASASEDPLRVSSEAWNSSFFQGKFRKYSASLGRSQYILKVEQSIAPELPQVEMLCNEIAASLGIPIPGYYLVLLFDKNTFVTKNFISEIRGGVNLTHIYHYVNDADEYNCENLIKIISEQTQQFSDVEIFIHVCLFDSLIGNHDRHGRNLGFLVTANKTRLAPIYDNTSAIGLESGEFLKMQFEPRGKIYTNQSKEPKASDYVIEFKRLGYDGIVEDFIRSININNILSLIQNSYCSDGMKLAIHTLFQRRYQEVQDAL